MKAPSHRRFVVPQPPGGCNVGPMKPSPEKLVGTTHAVLLRQELSSRNSALSASRNLPFALSRGEIPVVVYEPSSDLARHGNFLDESYSAILSRPEWKCRLDKVHSQSRSLPKKERIWKELDSCMSSDALLMNLFCFPGITENRAVMSLLGVECGSPPEFGFKARVPLNNSRADRTEVDMKIGALLVESKLTESDFQTKAVDIVRMYRDFEEVFESQSLVQLNDEYASYQLIRNVLAAHSLGLAFCVLLDSRRPDLLESWYAVMKCVRIAELRTRCKVLTWQELSQALPIDPQTFLDVKYGIVPPGRVPSTMASPEQ